MNSKFPLTIALSLLVFLLSCSGGKSVAGGSSDTELGMITVSGIIRNDAGKPVSGAIITLCQAGKTPRDLAGREDIDTTDSEGRYDISFKKSATVDLFVAVGTLEIKQTDIAKKLSEDLEIPAIVIDEASIKTLGTLKVILPTVLRNTTGEFLFIEGTTISVPLDHSGDTIEINSVPTNTRLKIYCSMNLREGKYLTIADSVVLTTASPLVVGRHDMVLNIVDSTKNFPNANISAFVPRYDVSVRTVSVENVTPNDTLGIDVIYISAETDTLYDMLPFIKSVKKPIICASSDLYPDLGMTSSDKYGSEIGVSMLLLEPFCTFDTNAFGDKEIPILKNSSAIAKIEWGISDRANKIAMSSGNIPTRSYYFYTATSEQLSDNSLAPGFRVGIFGCTSDQLGPEAKEIVYRTIKWLGEEADLE